MGAGFAILSGLLLGLTTGAGGADERPPPAFSAEVVATGPAGVVSSGRLYVSGEKMRLDTRQGDRSWATIVDGASQTTWTLFPERKAYLEARGPGSGAAGVQGVRGPPNPCDGIPGAVCERVAEEEIEGRPAEKWRIEIPAEGQTLLGFQWIDRERGIPLRQQMPGGVRTELRFLSMDEVAGRPVEKWELTTSGGGREPARSHQWYDPALGLAVRQTMPGGYVTELRGVETGAQPEELFRVPPDYERVTMPGAPPPRGR
jgi:hypothetical protein